MDIFGNIALGFSEVMSLETLAYCLFGVTVGMLIGVLPGIGAMAAISMLMPITFYLEPGQALIMLAGIYYGAQYGNSITSILLNVPGTPSSAVTALDGYPLSRQGKAGPAIFITTAASFFGSCFAIVCLAAFSPIIAGVALKFGSGGIFRADGLRSDHRLDRGTGLADQGHGHGGDRAGAGAGRHRHHLGHLPLHLRPDRTERRLDPGRGRHGRFRGERGDEQPLARETRAGGRRRKCASATSSPPPRT